MLFSRKSGRIRKTGMIRRAGKNGKGKHNGKAYPAHNGVVADGKTGAVIGRVAGVDEAGCALVHYAVNPTGAAVLADSTVPIKKQDVGREAVLVFRNGDTTKPIVMGLIQPAKATHEAEAKTVDVERDGERLTLTADKEIVLSCGRASITLTRAGKVMIRGTYVLSRSSGVHRVQGGSVQIN
jgi:hypothetical protein